MKIHLVHDYLMQDGGAERVLQVFHRMWPDAPIHVLFADTDKVPAFRDAEIRETFLGRIKGIGRMYRVLLPIMPIATERHIFPGADVVLSSTSAFAKGIITKPGTVHVSYCHTPPRFLWEDMHEYIRDLRFGSVLKWALIPILHHMRTWDRVSVDRVDAFIANSQAVADRIQKYYRRSSVVIPPPVDTSSFFLSKTQEPYFVSGGRLVSYKRFDLLIEAWNRMTTPLIIFGDGPKRRALEKQAKPHIRFVGQITEKEKAELLSKAQAFVHPQIEDFGITAIESMASGRPVIAFGEGGAKETVIDGETGIVFFEQSWQAIFLAVQRYMNTSWHPERIREHAMRYDTKRFQDRIESYIRDMSREQAYENRH